VDTPDFIVPPPGLIPAAPPPREQADEEVPETSRRVLPSFPPPSAFPSPPVNTSTVTATTITPKPLRPVGVWRLRGEGGLEVALQRSVLLGRDPATDPSRAGAASVALVDPARTVSKTHALVEVVDDRVLVTDLHSTNGTRLLDAHGNASELVPGEPAEAPSGATLLLGEFALRVDRAPTDTV
jgi:pSer/pThr/pTyr-binding forkhead associated (FHA) protein